CVFVCFFFCLCLCVRVCLCVCVCVCVCNCPPLLMSTLSFLLSCHLSVFFLSPFFFPFRTGHRRPFCMTNSVLFN
ncbi:MAG: hypothetical protein PV344_06720, partial [Anaplasma sp.]|nr:hypothetical protein [Anaplasma sp.]